MTWGGTTVTPGEGARAGRVSDRIVGADIRFKAIGHFLPTSQTSRSAKEGGLWVS